MEEHVNYGEAVKLHTSILEAAGKSYGRFMVIEVVKLHAPNGNRFVPENIPSCLGCPVGDYAESENLWIDCLTLKTLNVWLKVDGYPSGIVMREPITCTPAERRFCPVCGPCTCRRAENPYRIVYARSCPLHGESSTHANGEGAKLRGWS